MDFRHRRRDDQQGEQPAQQPLAGEVTVTLDKSGGGSRSVRLPRERLQGLTYRQVVEAAALSLDNDRAFAEGVRRLLGDRSYSLERAESGRQSHPVKRDAPIDEALLEEDDLRFVLSRDHHGGL